MLKTPESSRREFLNSSGKLVVGEALLGLAAIPHRAGSAETAAPPPSLVKSSCRVEQFYFGASVYPELQTRDEWSRMLDHIQRAQMNVVRVSESAWGNLETAAGQYNFEWLQQFLDDLSRRMMKAILGTGSFIPPQWLAAGNPEILAQLHPGVKAHPMARHAPCLNHPLYRSALREYILAMANAFKGHPAVIAWQLGNEQEGAVARLCFNPSCERAWKEWLKKTYRTPEEFNRRLNLVSWGMKVQSLDEVPQPAEGVEESGTEIAALSLAHRHFRRDVLLGFFAMQAAALREAGVEQWIITDWNTVWDAVADDPQAGEIMDIAGLNYYQPSADDAEFWSELAWHQDMHRSAYGRQHFITTENRFGVMGGTAIWDPSPSREQFLMYGLQAAAFGSCASLYWTGNRWRGGHWPHWGGLLDWSGHPEPDFAWAGELGKIFDQWGPCLIANPVKATAVALNDFEQRAALEIYPHIKASPTVLRQSFEAMHRLGIGVDSMNLAKASSASNLAKYSLVLVPAATALDDPKVIAALRDFAQGGGIVVVTPFTAYQDKDGIFRGDGFGANLRELAGGLVRTVRWMGMESASQNMDPAVEWLGAGMTRTSPVGLEGYCEFLEVDPEAEVVARFKSRQSIVDGRPATTVRKLGRGRVVKLAWWPGDDSLLSLVGQLLPGGRSLLAAPVPVGVLAVPHADDSLFIVNTTPQKMPVRLAQGSKDRISGGSLEGTATLAPFQVVWLEQTA